ncbi:MAG: CarD family transcriptional regulator [Hyphomicrobium sp.]
MAQKKKASPPSKTAAKAPVRKGAELKVASAAVKTSKAPVKAKVELSNKAPAAHVAKGHAVLPAKAKSHATPLAAKLAKKPIAPVKSVIAAKPVVGAKIAAQVKPAVVGKPGAKLPASTVGVKKPFLAAALAAKVAAGQAHPQRAVPAAAHHKAIGQKVSAPVASQPKGIAEKTSAARQLLAVQKKPVNQRHGFKANEFIVYPAHGVGRIVGIEEQEIAGMSLELFVITFDKEKLTLRVPTGKLTSVGMRKLADEPLVKKAMDTLKGRARVKRTMWSRRAQEYVAKINSGDLISIAEVVRDLYRSDAQPEQSYSERQLYEDALDRMARELAAVEKLDERGAVQRITEVLSKSAKSRRLASDGDTVGEAA